MKAIMISGLAFLMLFSGCIEPFDSVVDSVSRVAKDTNQNVCTGFSKQIACESQPQCNSVINASGNYVGCESI
jgi:hypothetical protein